MSENIPYCACGDGITAEDAGYCGTCGSELRAQIAHYRDQLPTERTRAETAEATVARLREENAKFRELAHFIVTGAVPATTSGATCFVPRYEIDKLRALLEGGA